MQNVFDWKLFWPKELIGETPIVKQGLHLIARDSQSYLLPNFYRYISTRTAAHSSGLGDRIVGAIQCVRDDLLLCLGKDQIIGTLGLEIYRTVQALESMTESFTLPIFDCSRMIA
jgi:hypothetical protein